MDLSWCLLLATVLLSNLAQALDVNCMHAVSKKCIISQVNVTDPADVLVLPDLSNRTTLQIKGGNLNAFDESLCGKLGTVEKLQLGSLRLMEICLTVDLLEVSAVRNKIEIIKFTDAAGYKLQKIDLRGNQMRSLDGFEVLRNLVEIHLEYNELETLNWTVFSPMIKLEKLYLNDNNLKLVIAEEVINLPVLEYLSLANNQIQHLVITNWQFDSLTEYDISANNLSRVDNLANQFTSAQIVRLANNQWYCGWLQDTLDNFNLTYVTIKDQDENCEGISPANICCAPEVDTLPEDSDSRKTHAKLNELEKEQKVLRSELESELNGVKSQNENKLLNLKSKLELAISASQTNTDTGITETNTQRKYYEQQLQNVQGKAMEQMQAVSFQRRETETAQRRLSYTVLELKNSIDKGKRAVTGVREQLNHLRNEIYNSKKQRE